MIEDKMKEIGAKVVIAPNVEGAPLDPTISRIVKDLEEILSEPIILEES